MKNVTISMDDELLRATRVAAATAGMSVSKFLAEAARKQVNAVVPADSEETRLRLERLQRVFDGPKLPISRNGRMPTADERNARR